LRSSLVLGAGGLLGRAITNELLLKADSQDLVHKARVNWREPEVAELQISKLIENWLKDHPYASHELFWCAGRGGPRADHQMILQEETFFIHVLKKIEEYSQETDVRYLKIFFASSAGGIYGDTGECIATELTQPKPSGTYGLMKHRLELALQEFSKKVHCTSLIGRISSIYGPSHHLRGRQGLLGHMAFSIANNQPISLFASLSTARNYIDVESAACLAVSLLRECDESTHNVRNIASPYSPSIAELLVLARQLAGRKLLFRQERLVTTEQSRIATEFPDIASRLIRTTLAEGFSKLIRAERLKAISGSPTKVF